MSLRLDGGIGAPNRPRAPRRGRPTSLGRRRPRGDSCGNAKVHTSVSPRDRSGPGCLNTEPGQAQGRRYSSGRTCDFKRPSWTGCKKAEIMVPASSKSRTQLSN
ncbi:uncharacterized protein ACBT57_005724 [Dama dama]